MTADTHLMPAAPYLRRKAGRGAGPSRRAGSSVLELTRAQAADPLFVLTALFLAGCILFGGASRNNALQVAGLELFALPVMALALWRLWRGRELAKLRLPALVLALSALIPILHLVPLPYDVWAGLAGRDRVAEVVALVGVTPGWTPLSLDPPRTLDNLLALLVPASMFFGAVACDGEQRRGLAMIVLAGCVLSLVLGIAQLAGGAGNPLWFYEPGNLVAAVGLFANRNHQALMMLLFLPLAAGCFAPRAWRTDGRFLAGAAVLLGLVGAMAVGVVESRSRAGLVLLLPAALGALAILWRARRRGSGKAVLLLLAGALVVGLAVVLSGPFVERFAPTLAADSRQVIWATTVKAADVYAPWGSGIGSFQRIYASLEPIESMQLAFINHAHNEYLELWLEAGWAALIPLGLFGVWAAYLAAKAWRRSFGGAPLAQAGSVVVLLVLLHSVVDYPVRTLSIAAIFAVACALLVKPTTRRLQGEA